MQENLPPELPLPTRQPPVHPDVVPIPPTRRRPPGRGAPLPDPVAVRRVAIPDAAPPYDDEPQTAADAGPPRAAAEAGLAPSPAPDGAGGKQEPVDPTAGPPEPGDPTAGEPEPGGPTASEHEPGDPTAGPPEPGPPPPGERSSAGPQAWPSQFAQVLAETLAGSRPATQLRPWTTEQTRQRIRQLGPMLATGQRPRVRRIMTSAPSPDVLEMTAVVGFGSRIRVLALRLERAEEACQHWRCTAIESA
jgi:hypothetical protein